MSGPSLFSSDRTRLRGAYREAWRKHGAGEPLQPLEQRLVEVISQHPEYQAGLADESVLARDFLPEAGQVNPFLHMGLHLALLEQLGTDRPAGILALYRSLLPAFPTTHALEHAMIDCLGAALWEARRNAREPDEGAYLECLRGLRGRRAAPR